MGQQRVIKFRAWVDGKMSPTFSMLDILKEGKDLYITKRHNHFSEDRWYLNECIIMQFTGLHDKNGKEVYEGDIVNHDNVLGVVRFNKGSFSMYNLFDLSTKKYFKNDVEWHLSIFVPEDIEGLGNIHENLELLKQVKHV